MIERYFQPGVRLKWRCPPAGQGGAMDGSVINTPAVSSTTMTYDGLDGDLFQGGPHISTFGLSMGMTIDFDWLAYVRGHTAKIRSNRDVLTGPMSGCLITRWTDGTGNWVGHLGTTDSSADISSRVKSTFADFMPDNTIGFNPVRAWDGNETWAMMGKFKQRPDTGISLALVTPSNDFYSLLLLAISGTHQSQWCVAGCKKMPAMDYHELKFALYGTRPRR